jgi:two-component system response regulator MprA
VRILVVEDDGRMSSLLRQALTEEGHTVTLAANGRTALSLASIGFDIILLDVMLPGLDGLQVARSLRGSGDPTPILMLTARDAVDDIVRGLDVGADDYLTKPFSLDVLFARVRALGRRQGGVQTAPLKAAGLRVNPSAREVFRGDRRIELTRTEYAILELLLRNAGRIVTRSTLIERVWGHDSEIESNTLDVFVRLLRGKVEEEGRERIIRTVRGIGYTLGGEAT